MVVPVFLFVLVFFKFSENVTVMYFPIECHISPTIFVVMITVTMISIAVVIIIVIIMPYLSF